MLSSAGLDGLVQDNLGLVHSCARRFAGKGVEYDDLFQAGCMGLVKACRNFDDARGFRFSTYAVPVILGEIKRLFRDGGTVKVSRRLREISMKASRASFEMMQSSGEEPTAADIARRIGCEEELVVEAVCAARPAISLTMADDECEERESDIAVLDEQDSVSERLTLADAVSRLTEEERAILTERFYNSRTQAEVARELGTTQVQISRRERRIIEKLRGMMADGC